MNTKVAVITGAANGIGKGIAEKFAKEGYQIVIADIDDLNGEKVAKSIVSEGGRAEYFKIDLLREEEIEKLFEFVYDKYDRIDTVICNAGVQIRDWAVDFDSEQFDMLMGINVRAYYLCARTAARYMKNQESKGNIVCISSVNSISYHSKRSPYNISKAAINGMVGTLAVEWGRDNIRINAVAPGYVKTELMESGIREGIIDEKNIMSVIPYKRYIEIEEIANVVLFLSSDMASGVTGQVIYVDGGWSKNALPEDKNME